jgi:hypothetical protein
MGSCRIPKEKDVKADETLGSRVTLGYLEGGDSNHRAMRQSIILRVALLVGSVTATVGQPQIDRPFKVVLVPICDDADAFVLQVLTTVRVTLTIQNFTLLPVAAYSSSSGTGVHDLSGLKRSIFMNSLKLANPKSFS